MSESISQRESRYHGIVGENLASLEMPGHLVRHQPRLRGKDLTRWPKKDRGTQTCVAWSSTARGNLADNIALRPVEPEAAVLDRVLDVIHVGSGGTRTLEVRLY